MPEYSIGLDLGGTNLRAAAIERGGTMLDKISGETDFKGGRDAVLGDIAATIAKLRDKHGAGGLAGIGVGVPGFIRVKEGLITGSNNLAILENVPVRDELSRRLGTRVILENDANAAALGEKWIGAGRHVDDLVLLTLGTGIGGGIISGGRIVRGSVGMAGEFGHISVVVNGNPCGCGNQGCLEKHASASAVTAMAKLMRLGDGLSSKDVYDLAKTVGDAGDKARHIWKVVGESLGLMMAMLINTFNFPLYLLSGGMLPAWELFEPHMTRVAKERSFTFRATLTETRIAQATLGNEAGLFGAAYLPWIEA
ncbi:MAG: glucokinase [Candidatus Solibacter sp.]|jgi:glucokinase|nr:glucokinase [Candidatus Solibacter sp.]